MKSKRKSLMVTMRKSEESQLLTRREDAHLERRPGLAKAAESEHEVRIVLRLPADIHREIRMIAQRERLSLNQVLVRASEQFSESTHPCDYRQLSYLIEACKLLGPDQTPQLRRALAERVNQLYELDPPLDCKDKKSDEANQHSVDA